MQLWPIFASTYVITLTSLYLLQNTEIVTVFVDGHKHISLS